MNFDFEIIRRHRAALWVYAFHFVQERIRNPSLRRYLAKLVSKFMPRDHAVTLSADPHLAKLNESGYAFVGDVLTQDSMSRLHDQLKALPCVDRYRRHLGSFNINDVPAGTHVADIDGVVGLKEVLKVANDPRILSIVSSYFGCRPIIDSILAWWSVPGNDAPQEAEFFHRDNDGIQFLKLFIYLTDVTPESGPHVFIEGSHRQNKLLTRSARLDDAVVEKEFGASSIRSFTGPAGLAFIEDTFGVHKGQMPTDAKRLLLQVRYSIMPTIFLNRTIAVATEFDANLDAYASRFIVQKKVA